MPAKAGIQDFKYLNKIKNWIPASSGMTTLFPIATQSVNKEDTSLLLAKLLFFPIHLLKITARRLIGASGATGIGIVIERYSYP
jgi:hypothetical protein